MTDSTICSKEGCNNKTVFKKTGLCRTHGCDRKLCVTEGCTKLAHCAGGLCDKHAGKQKPICETEGCSNQAISGKKFCTHHGGRKLCETEGCNKQARGGGHCRKHGAKVPMCSVEGCENVVKNNHLCIAHGANVDQEMCNICKDTYGKKRWVEDDEEYVRLCAQCYADTYPNERRPKLNRRKQIYLKGFLDEDYGSKFFIHDKKVKGGQSFKRPDFLHIFDNYALIVECDEGVHRHWKYKNETLRLEIIQKDLKNLPIICVRWNPDDNETDEGCFKIDEDDNLIVDDDEFILRYTKLKESINKYTNDTQIEGIQIEELFY